VVAKGREVGVRPRWPDLLIVLAIVALAVVGVVTLFGPAIRGWFAPTTEASQKTARPAPGVAP
jgi:hypothetical protein